MIKNDVFLFLSVFALVGTLFYFPFYVYYYLLYGIELSALPVFVIDLVWAYYFIFGIMHTKETKQEGV